MKRAYFVPGATASALLLASNVALAQQDGQAESATQEERMAQEGGVSGGLMSGSSGRIGTGASFNPSISVILDGVYKNTFSGDAHDPGGFDGGHDHGHGHGGGGHGTDEGFNLRETEFAFQASVDPYFDAFAVLAIEGADSIDLEEAYFTTSSLPLGLQIKGGRFLSDVGYINSRHPHEWDFVDRPLVNEYLFGDHGLQETGVQLNWLLPTRTYLKAGVEVLQGETSGIAAYEGETSTRPGWIEGTNGDTDQPGRLRTDELDLPFDDASAPRLFTGFLKWGPDLGYDHAAQFGISGGYARTFQRMDEHSEGLRVEAWDGDAWFAGLDAVYKYDAGGYLGQGDLTLQGEYFYRNIDTDFSYFNSDFARGEVTDGDGQWQRDTVSADGTSGRFQQDGAYVQAVYGIAPRWRTGVRAEALGIAKNRAWHDRDEGNGFADFDTSYRYSLNTTFYPSHFSFIRGQFNYADYADDDPNDGHGHDEWSFMLQYNVSLGAHGAHPF